MEIRTTSKTLTAVYVRVSSDKQEKWSPQAQRQVLLDHCERMGWEPVIYSETGSGETLEGRPQMVKLLADARARAFQVCLVVELERLSRDRDLFDWLTIKQTFRQAGIRIATPGQVYDLKDAEDDFMSDLFGALSKREKLKMIERMRRGRAQAKTKGTYLNEFVPYGWVIEDRKYTLHPVESEAVRLMVALGMSRSGRQIAKELTRQGFRTKTGHAIWNFASVNQLMQNPVLYGELRFAGAVTPIPPIITKAEWLALQEKIRGRQLHPRQDRIHPYLLNGLAYCGVCGRRLGCRTDWYRYTRADGTRVEQRRYAFYVCAGRGVKDCTIPAVKGDVLEHAAWEEIKRHLKSPRLIYDALNMAYQDRDRFKTAKGQEETHLEGKLEALTRQEARLAQDYYGGRKNLSDAAFSLALDNIRQERKILQERLREVTETPLPEVKDLVQMDNLEGACAQLAAGIDSWTFEAKKEALDLILDKVTVNADYSLVMTCRLPLSEDPMSGTSPGHQCFEISIPPIRSIFAKFRRWPGHRGAN